MSIWYLLQAFAPEANVFKTGSTVITLRFVSRSCSTHIYISQADEATARKSCKILFNLLYFSASEK